MRKINVLGTEYSIYELAENEDSLLKNCDGYCDKTTKKIVVLQFDKNNCEIEDIEWYRKKVMRHEIVHAFLFESGLAENVNHWKSPGGHDEQMVDWFAIQFPKLQKVYEELGVL